MDFTKQLLKAFLIIIIPMSVNAGYIKGRFLITEKSHNFVNNTVSGGCKGQLSYPSFSNTDDEIVEVINGHILGFVKTYAICNKGNRKNFAVTFEINTNKLENNLSVKWVTFKNKKIYRIDALTFNAMSGNLLHIDDIFNQLGEDMLKELAKLSGGRLKFDISWEEFVEKLGKKDIQFYLKQDKWYLAFNPTRSNEKPLEIAIPDYFLHERR